MKKEDIIYIISDEIDFNKRIDIFLSKKMNFSRNYVLKLINENLIYKNETLITKQSIKIYKNDIIKIIKKKM